MSLHLRDTAKSGEPTLFADPGRTRGMIVWEVTSIKRRARRLATQFGYFEMRFSLLNVCVFALDAVRGVRWPGPLNPSGSWD